MVFYCKACGATLRKDDIDFETGIACCQHCQAVMSFAQEMGLKPQATPPPPPPREVPEMLRPIAPRPKKLKVEETVQGLQFTRPWFSPVHIFFAFFCVFWDGFLIVWYPIGLTVAGGPGSGPGLMMFLFPLIHVAVGVGLTYYTICGFVNRTILNVSDTTLSIEHKPLPWRGNRSLGTSNLKQLYCERKVSRSKNGTTVTYNLNAILTNGEKHQLLTGLPQQDIAIYLEQQIEKRLGIEDERVAGDVV